MSDSILRYVPADPFWQPSREDASKAAALLRSIAPKADSVEAHYEDKVSFYDPGENWSGVKCSACGAEAEQWWGEAMDRAFTSDFTNLRVDASCCGATVSLNDLHYVWPAAFGRFALEAHNPNMSDTTEEQDRQIGECLGKTARKIWVRI